MASARCIDSRIYADTSIGDVTRAHAERLPSSAIVEAALADTVETAGLANVTRG